MNEKFDFIVVGSGPGGATTARELSKNGKRVAILERGPHPRLRGSFMQFLRYLLVPFQSLMFTRGFISMVRGLIAGGSSVFYYAAAFKVPVDMLKKYGINVEKEVAETMEELPIAPLKDEMMTPMANRIMDTAKKLGYKWERLNKFMYQDRWRPGMPFGYYGDPNDVKWSARMYVDEAVKNGTRLFTRAKVTRVLIENEKAVGVEYGGLFRKKRLYANTVIVAAGGIGSPVILRKSGIPGAGYDFFFDPLITAYGLVDDMEAGAEIPMSAGAHMEKEGYMLTDMALPPVLDGFFAILALKFHRIFAQRRTLRIMIKLRDGLGGRITRTGQVSKALTKDDKKRLEEGFRHAKAILEAAGAKKVYKSRCLAAHPGGTVKIGELVDSNLKSVNYDNLYVCDCSVIPEPWGLPPTLTLVSLAKRLTGHLLEK